MIQAGDQNTAALRGALHWAAAFVLFFNAVAFGFASGAMADLGGSGVLSVVCGSSVDLAQDDAGSKAPSKAHCVACAILHASSAVENALAEIPAKTAPDEAPPVLLVSIFNPDAIQAAPELRPLCSRAPPSRTV
ncbi:MAG: DUF2946 family protein [Methylocystis sp.]|uniref:DUF2946 family protein n=1 Tax=Methylocystis sp. TaxID=1911079 RepID=UPI003DA6C897